LLVIFELLYKSTSTPYAIARSLSVWALIKYNVSFEILSLI